MDKLYCIETYSYTDNNKIIEVNKGKLYYSKYFINGRVNIYDFETAEYIGMFLSNLFGPYNLWVANERERKINEILDLDGE